MQTDTSFPSDEALNIAVCEWRGWKRSNGEAKDEGFEYYHEVEGEKLFVRSLPSHITGPEALGNMHEAEKGLTVMQQNEYTVRLTDMLREKIEWRYFKDFTIIHATARQRAIALLRVVKLEMFE